MNTTDLQGTTTTQTTRLVDAQGSRTFRLDPAVANRRRIAFWLKVAAQA